MWTYDYDKRPDPSPGWSLCMFYQLLLEGYKRQTPDGKSYVNEKLKVNEIQMTCEPISKIGAKIDEKDEEIPF